MVAEHRWIALLGAFSAQNTSSQALLKSVHGISGGRSTPTGLHPQPPAAARIDSSMHLKAGLRQGHVGIRPGNPKSHLCTWHALTMKTCLRCPVEAEMNT